jgi:hypothetical protein
MSAVVSLSSPPVGASTVVMGHCKPEVLHQILAVDLQGMNHPYGLVHKACRVSPSDCSFSIPKSQ